MDESEEIHEEPVTIPTCANVRMEDNRVIVVLPFHWLAGIVATGFYGLFVYAIVEDGFPFRNFSWGLAVTSLILTAAWLWFLLRQRVVTVFDGFEKKVYRKNLLYTMRVVDFSDVAGVMPVGEGGAGAGLYFKIALAADRLGKGLRLTRSYNDDCDELACLTYSALPAIAAMLEKEQAPGGAAVAAAPNLESPTCYERSGSQYVFKRWGSVVLIILAGLGLNCGGVALGEWILSVIGVVVMLFAGLATVSVTLDTDAKTIALARGFGLWKKIYPMGRYVGIHVTRSYTNGLYTGTTAAFEFHEPPEQTDLSWAYFTKKLTVLVDETSAIIESALHREES